MTPAEMDNAVEELADRLRGTCNSLTDEEQGWIESVPGFAEALDAKVFLCEQCGWWCGEDEYGKKDMHCDECSPTEDDGFPDDDDDADSDDDSGDEYEDDDG